MGRPQMTQWSSGSWTTFSRQHRQPCQQPRRTSTPGRTRTAVLKPGNVARLTPLLTTACPELAPDAYQESYQESYHMSTTTDPATSQTAPAVATGLAIRTEHLTKAYGARAAVDDVSLEVPTGVIAGFVGPNGAGKTTTIRMVLALARPTAGRIGVGGRPPPPPQFYLPRVGALMGGPAFYPGRGARRNLEVLAALGGIERGRVDPLLAQVGLEGREGDAVKTYSQGMRQRLG